MKMQLSSTCLFLMVLPKLCSFYDYMVLINVEHFSDIDFVSTWTFTTCKDIDHLLFRLRVVLFIFRKKTKFSWWFQLHSTFRCQHIVIDNEIAKQGKKQTCRNKPTKKLDKTTDENTLLLKIQKGHKLSKCSKAIKC